MMGSGATTLLLAPTAAEFDLLRLAGTLSPPKRLNLGGGVRARTSSSDNKVSSSPALADSRSAGVPSDSSGAPKNAASIGPLTLLQVGVGAASARTLEAWLAGQPNPKRVILAGFAGGLDPTLRAGTAVIADALIVSGERVAASLPVALQRTRGTTIGPIAGVDRIMESPDEKRTLHRDTGALAVEMETGPIAALCRVKGLPLAVARVIVDPADVALPAGLARWVKPNGDLSVRAIGWSLLGLEFSLFRAALALRDRLPAVNAGLLLAVDALLRGFAADDAAGRSPTSTVSEITAERSTSNSRQVE
jgi:nucleoside phosphorylase